MHSTDRTRELVVDLDSDGPPAERAVVELSHMGGAAVPALVEALEGGLMRRFNAARTLGKIGIDAGYLVDLDEASRTEALAATRAALQRERTMESGPEGVAVCMALERAVHNLSEARTVGSS